MKHLLQIINMCKNKKHQWTWSTVTINGVKTAVIGGGGLDRIEPRNCTEVINEE